MSGGRIVPLYCWKSGGGDFVAAVYVDPIEPYDFIDAMSEYLSYDG
jgi:hypothetical protein